MLEVTSLKKNKISLVDYPYEQDIQSRMLLSDLSIFDVEVLEEIFYNPLKISLKKLVRQLDCEESQLLSLLQRLSQVGLLTFDQDLIVVDKEMRKHFEFQLLRFQSDFKPDLEFIQGILKKVPIHILPTWYAIPRTSNNIFESIIEKYLLTPPIYQRYLAELPFTNPILRSILQDLFHSPDFTLTSTDLIAKYNLERREFEKILLLLEFHFVCYLYYKKEDDHWVELITPFYEWQEYLRFLKVTETPLIEEVVTDCAGDFTFVEQMAAILQAIRKKPKAFPSSPAADKLCLIQLAERKENGLLSFLPAANEWLELSIENQALYLYRHPLNLPSQGEVREAEKAIKRVLHGKWVFFDDFLSGVFVTLSDHSSVKLQRTGKQWKYVLPTYTKKEKELIHQAIFESLFEAGMVKTGICQGKECFAVTAFGRFLFEE